MQTFITCLSFLVRCMLKQCFILSYTIIKVLCIQKSFFPLLLRNKAGLTLKTNPRLPRNSLNSQVSFELLPRSEITGVNHHAHFLLWVLFSFFGIEFFLCSLGRSGTHRNPSASLGNIRIINVYQHTELTQGLLKITGFH